MLPKQEIKYLLMISKARDLISRVMKEMPGNDRVSGE